MRKQLHIGELAHLVGVTPKTVRHYHKIGLLPEPTRAPNGYRLYSSDHLRQLQRIRQLRALGLSLEHIRRVLTDAHPGDAFRNVLETHLDEIESRLVELEEQRDRIIEMLAEPEIHIDLPSENESFYLERIREQLADSLPTLDEQLLAQETAVDTLLGSFHWPGIDQVEMDAFLNALEEQPESTRQFVMQYAQIWTQLTALPPESPEVAEIAKNFVRENYHILQQFQQSEDGETDNHAITAVFSEMTSDILTPTQQRFMEQVIAEWAQLARESEDETELTTTSRFQRLI